MSTPTSFETDVRSIEASSTDYVYALTGTGNFWASTSTTGMGVGSVLDFSFYSSPLYYASSYSSLNEPTNASILTEAQKTAVRAALAAWGNVADLQFNEVVDSSAQVGKLRFGIYDAMSAASGWGYAPSFLPSGGDVWLSPTKVDTASLPVGSDSFKTLVHEIGHVLGLKHPFDAPGTLTGAENSQLYTIMAYAPAQNSLFLRVVDSGGGFSGEYSNIVPDGPMLYDIAAIQYLYGANDSYRTGDDLYTFDPDAPFLRTLWDAGGNDTISVSNFVKPSIIDLRDGHFSSIRIESDPVPEGATGWMVPTYDGTDNLGIAFGVLIENAEGGEGDDRLSGNQAANRLIGNGGRDILAGGAGDDTYGVDNSGDQVMELSSSGLDTVESTVSYYLMQAWHVENLLLIGSNSINGAGNWLDNRIIGNDAANALDGDRGNDTLEGGAGHDTLTGGGGADCFVFNSAPDPAINLDILTDFAAGEDKLALEDVLFPSFAVGSLAASQFVSGAGVTAAVDANDHLIYDTTNGMLYYDPDGSGATVAMQFAILLGNPALTASDFLVI